VAILAGGDDAFLTSRGGAQRGHKILDNTKISFSNFGGERRSEKQGQYGRGRGGDGNLLGVFPASGQQVRGERRECGGGKK